MLAFIELSGMKVKLQYIWMGRCLQAQVLYELCYSKQQLLVQKVSPVNSVGALGPPGVDPAAPGLLTYTVHLTDADQ